MGYYYSKEVKRSPGYEDPMVLASTPFTISEVEALYELFKKLSSSIIDDGLIHKEEFQLALFRNSNKRNLFADRRYEDQGSMVELSGPLLTHSHKIDELLETHERHIRQAVRRSWFQRAN